MSHQMPYPTRLLWDGRTGVARYNGQAARLWDAPALSVDPVYTIDYVPCVGIAEVQDRPCDPRRAMRPQEIAAADALLRLLVLGPVTGPAQAL